MAGHAQLKFVMTECSKTQIRLTGPNFCRFVCNVLSMSTDDDLDGVSDEDLVNSVEGM